MNRFLIAGIFLLAFAASAHAALSVMPNFQPLANLPDKIQVARFSVHETRSVKNPPVAVAEKLTSLQKEFLSLKALRSSS